MLLLAERLGHHDGDGALRAGNHPRWANFTATRVRFFLPLPPPALQSIRRLESAVKAPPVPLLGELTCAGTLALPALRTTIDLPTIALAAQQEWPPTCVTDALNQAKIVHRRAPPPEIRPPTATRATLDLSNASTAATEGSKVSASGPYSLVAPESSSASPRRANNAANRARSDFRAFRRSSTHDVSVTTQSPTLLIRHLLTSSRTPDLSWRQTIPSDDRVGEG